MKRVFIIIGFLLLCGTVQAATNKYLLVGVEATMSGAKQIIICDTFEDKGCEITDCFSIWTHTPTGDEWKIVCMSLKQLYRGFSDAEIAALEAKVENDPKLKAIPCNIPTAKLRDLDMTRNE